MASVLSSSQWIVTNETSWHKRVNGTCPRLWRRRAAPAERDARHLARVACRHSVGISLLCCPANRCQECSDGHAERWDARRGAGGRGGRSALAGERGVCEVESELVRLALHQSVRLGAQSTPQRPAARYQPAVS